MLILLAGHHKMFSKKTYLSGMKLLKYDVKTSKMTFLLNTEAYVLNNFLKLFMFVRPVTEQTKVHFKIVELLVNTFGTGR